VYKFCFLSEQYKGEFHMGGFHALDLIVIVGIALVIFGPKTLQSLARSAGHGLNQAKDAKNKLLAEFPMDDFAKISKTVSQIPLSPQQAARQLVNSAIKPDEEKPEEHAPEE
jgi:TatA/E family protein of Tat protein translocase